jgi:hypothetical protein
MRDRLIEKLNTFCKEELGTHFNKDILEQFADHLIADGWIRPPCKVGDKVWLIKSLNWQHTEWGIKEGKVSMIQQKADKSWKFRITENHSVQDFTVDKIGKTVFLAEEEAVQVLKGGVQE